MQYADFLAPIRESMQAFREHSVSTWSAVQYSKHFLSPKIDGDGVRKVRELQHLLQQGLATILRQNVRWLDVPMGDASFVQPLPAK